MDFKTDIQPILLGQARHLATVAGTALVGAGYLSSGKLATFEDAAVGIAVILGSMGFSALQKFIAANKQAQQLAVAYNTVPAPVMEQLGLIAQLIASSPKAAPIVQPVLPIAPVTQPPAPLPGA